MTCCAPLHKQVLKLEWHDDPEGELDDDEKDVIESIVGDKRTPDAPWVYYDSPRRLSIREAHDPDYSTDPEGFPDTHDECIRQVEEVLFGVYRFGREGFSEQARLPDGVHSHDLDDISFRDASPICQYQIASDYLLASGQPPVCESDYEFGSARERAALAARVARAEEERGAAFGGGHSLS